MPPLPAIDKSYEFDANRAVGGADENSTNATQWYNFAAEMTNTGTDPSRFTTPMICRGSSNGTASGMDGVNRWIDPAAVAMFSATLGRAWIVLELPGIHLTEADGSPAKNPVQILITRNSAAFAQISIAVSLRSGFGAVNGGTDGAANEEPTAADTWWPVWQKSLYGGSGNPSNLTQTLMMSTDGTICRLFLTGRTIARYAWVSFEVPRDAIDDWEDPFIVACCFGSGGTAPYDKDAWLAPATSSVISFMPKRTMPAGVGGVDKGIGAATDRGWNARGCLRMAQCGASATADFPETFVVAHPRGGGFVVSDAYIAGVTDPGYDHYWGRMNDFYFIGSNVAGGTGAGIGDALPSTGEKTWWCFGAIIFPGPNDSATDLVV